MNSSASASSEDVTSQMSRLQLTSIESEIKEISKIKDKQHQKQIKTVVIDVSYSTGYSQSNQIQVKDGIRKGLIPLNGIDYPVHNAIKSKIEEKYNSQEASTSDIGSFLSFAESESDLIDIITLGNPSVKPYREKTTNLLDTVNKLYSNMIESKDGNRGGGTSFVNTINEIIKSPPEIPPNHQYCIEIYCDGTSTDYPDRMKSSFNELFRKFPNVLIRIYAFVMKPCPRDSDVIGNDEAGIDIFHVTPIDHLDSFNAHWLLDKRDNGDWCNTRQIITQELAVGNKAGAHINICSVEIKIPHNIKTREMITRKIFNVLSKYPDELVNFNNNKMRDILQNLDSLGCYMNEDSLRALMYRLVRNWLELKGFTASDNEFMNKIEEYLNKFIFNPKTAGILSGKTLRNQSERQTTFKEIIKFWESGNKVINNKMIGAPCLIFNFYNMKIAFTTITHELLSTNNNETCLFRNDCMIIPSIACPGMSNDDYARMAIRRIISFSFTNKGVTIDSKSIINIAIMVKLSILIRKKYPDSEYERLICNIVKKMLDKEQFDRRTKKTMPSALSLISSDLPAPREHLQCPYFGSDVTGILKYASGISDEIEYMEIPDIKISDCSTKIDAITYDPIEGPVYKFAGQYYSQETKDRCIREGFRSHLGTPFVEENFSEYHHESIDEWYSKIREDGFKITDIISNITSHDSGGGGAAASGSSDTINTKVIVVPGGLSSGKSSTIDALRTKLKAKGYTIGTTKERHKGELPSCPDIFIHWPDEVSYNGHSFDRYMAGEATNGDKDWLRTNKPKYVIMNTNCQDGKYLGLFGEVLYLHGSLDPKSTETYNYKQWIDFVSFTIHNSKLRTEGFSLNGSNSQIWYKVASQKLKWIPHKIGKKLWNEIKRKSDEEILQGWNNHISSSNSLEDINLRIDTFISENL